MLYRLLRNNKESGPYTALQLKETGLKPYDLLWAEGKGAAWQYASELPELKEFAPIIEEQPFDRFFKKEEEKETVKETAVVQKTKPRFRISGDKIIMVEAGNMEVANNGVIKETKQSLLPKEPVVAEKVATTQDWQEMYTQWQPPQVQKKEIKKEPVEIETKYSESLDDLKKRYAEKVLNEKKEKKPFLVSASFVKQNMLAGVAILVLAVGGYVGYTLKQKKSAGSTENKPVVERADIAGDNSFTTQQTADDNTKANALTGNKKQPDVVKSAGSLEKNYEQISNVKSANKPLPTPVEKNTGDTKTTVAANQKTDAAASKSTALNNIKKEAAGKASTSVDNAASQPSINSGKNVSSANLPAVSETKPVAKQNVQKKIDDYISVKKVGGSNSSVQNVRLLVNNITDFPIDLAVINIQYFDSKGKFQKGETMYVKNIDGGNNVEVRVPDSDKSSSIKYKVSMVSADQKTLYLVAD